MDNVISPWAEEASVDAVFIDEGDAVQCRWTQHPALRNLSDVYAYSNASVQVYRRAARVLADGGKRLILSLKNGVRGAAPIAIRIGECPVPLDDFLDAMQAGTRRATRVFCGWVSMCMCVNEILCVTFSHKTSS